jgi:hypothetical protein
MRPWPALRGVLDARPGESEMAIYCLCFHGQRGSSFAIHRFPLPEDKSAMGLPPGRSPRETPAPEIRGGNCIPRPQPPANEA